MRRAQLFAFIMLMCAVSEFQKLCFAADHLQLIGQTLHPVFSQLLWYINICKTVSAFLETIRTNSTTQWITCKSMCSKSLGSVLERKYLCMAVPSESRVLVYEQDSQNA